MGHVALAQERRPVSILGQLAVRTWLHERSRFECDTGDVGAAQAHVVELALGIGLEFSANAPIGRPAAKVEADTFQKLNHLTSLISCLAAAPRTDEKHMGMLCCAAKSISAELIMKFRIAP